MWTVEIVDKYEDVDVCNDFDFETITEAYAFLWQCRESWISDSCDLILFKDADVYCIYDDYSV